MHLVTPGKPSVIYLATAIMTANVTARSAAIAVAIWEALALMTLVPAATLDSRDRRGDMAGLQRAEQSEELGEEISEGPQPFPCAAVPPGAVPVRCVELQSRGCGRRGTLLIATL